MIEDQGQVCFGGNVFWEPPGKYCFSWMFFFFFDNYFLKF